MRPALATTSGPLIVISSPYAKRGVVYEAYREHFGASGDPRILVAKGASRDFNPSLPQSVVDRALARDRAWASAEYLAVSFGLISSFSFHARRSRLWLIAVLWCVRRCRT